MVLVADSSRRHVVTEAMNPNTAFALPCGNSEDQSPLMGRSHVRCAARCYALLLRCALLRCAGKNSSRVLPAQRMCEWSITHGGCEAPAAIYS